MEEKKEHKNKHDLPPKEFYDDDDEQFDNTDTCSEDLELYSDIELLNAFLDHHPEVDR